MSCFVNCQLAVSQAKTRKMLSLTKLTDQRIYNNNSLFLPIVIISDFTDDGKIKRRPDRRLLLCFTDAAHLNLARQQGAVFVAVNYSQHSLVGTRFYDD